MWVHIIIGVTWIYCPRKQHVITCCISPTTPRSVNTFPMLQVFAGLPIIT